MYFFRTESGTTWQVEDGRITRIPDPYIPPEVAFAKAAPIVREPFVWDTPPEVGIQATFRLVAHGGTFGKTGRITTIIGRRLVGVPA